MWILFVFSLYSFVLYIVCYVVLSCLCICIYLYMEMETESCAVCYVTLYCLFMKWQIKIDNIAVFMCALKPNAKRSILFENMKNLIKKIIKKASLFLLLHPIREKKIQKAWTKNLVYERTFLVFPGRCSQAGYARQILPYLCSLLYSFRQTVIGMISARGNIMLHKQIFILLKVFRFCHERILGLSAFSKPTSLSPKVCLLAKISSTLQIVIPKGGKNYVC